MASPQLLERLRALALQAVPTFVNGHWRKPAVRRGRYRALTAHRAPALTSGLVDPLPSRAFGARCS